MNIESLSQRAIEKQVPGSYMLSIIPNDNDWIEESENKVWKKILRINIHFDINTEQKYSI